MSKRADLQVLESMHAKLAQAFAEGIEPEPVLDKEGNCVGYKRNPAILSAARQFLKDNNIAGAAVEGNEVEKLAKSLGNLPYGDDELTHIDPHFTH